MMRSKLLNKLKFDPWDGADLVRSASFSGT